MKPQKPLKVGEPRVAYGTHALPGIPRRTTVKIADFKAKLSQYLREVKSGHPLTVLDRETPIARVLPYENGLEELKTRKATRSLKDFCLPPPLKLSVDPVQYLLEDRNSGR